MPIFKLKSKNNITPKTEAEEGRLGIGALLLENGAEVQDKAGQTPLHWAARKGHIGVLALLLNRGAEGDRIMMV